MMSSALCRIRKRQYPQKRGAVAVQCDVIEEENDCKACEGGDCTKVEHAGPVAGPVAAPACSPEEEKKKEEEYSDEDDIDQSVPPAEVTPQYPSRKPRNGNKNKIQQDAQTKRYVIPKGVKVRIRSALKEAQKRGVLLPDICAVSVDKFLEMDELNFEDLKNLRKYFQRNNESKGHGVKFQDWVNAGKKKDGSKLHLAAVLFDAHGGLPALKFIRKFDSLFDSNK